MNYQKWTKEETEFLKENYATMRLSELTEKLNKHKEQIRNKSKDMGLRKNAKVYSPRRYWSDKELKFLINNYPKLTLYEIGKELNRDPIAVKAKAIREGVYYKEDKKLKQKKKQCSFYEPTSIRAFNETYKLRV